MEPPAGFRYECSVRSGQFSLQFSAGLAGERRSGLNEKRYVYILPSDTMKQNRVMPQEKVDVKREDLCIY
jgi:hypothetical protein